MQDGEKGVGGRLDISFFFCQTREHSPTSFHPPQLQKPYRYKGLFCTLFSFWGEKGGKGLKTCLRDIKGMDTWPFCGSLNVMCIAVSPGPGPVPDTQ